ncbi:hypothetical protein CRYUN_Cryun04dG0155300 [Craigia yunnanensis]
MDTTQGKPDSEKFYIVLHVVDLRTRMDPPLLKYDLVNINRFAIALPSINSEEECFLFCLCGFPPYETDFGWGRPIWVGSASLTFNNLMVFMDKSSSGAIEACINMKEEGIARFEGDKELLAFVCSTPAA